ncbi:MAG: amidohydrolase family protein [Planctomycetota bacterium]
MDSGATGEATGGGLRRATLVRAGSVAGFGGFDGGEARPGAVLLDADGEVAAAGAADELEREFGGDVGRTEDRPGELLLPRMVNAHCHFELTAIGPRPYTGSFTRWVTRLIEERPRDAGAVARSVALGAAMSLAAGVEAVGDIGGARFGEDAAWDALRDSALVGVYFPELLAMDGERADAELERLRALLEGPADTGGMRRGVSPHAPYSTGPAVYEAAARAAADHGVVVTTHLAETLDEQRFVAEAAGPFREFLESRGLWADRYARQYGSGRSPVRWMEPYLRRGRWVLAHCNYVDDDDIALLAETGASVAYCPVASAYFGHRDHRYRDMLAAGVNVGLGTDSIVCQPSGEEQPLGLLPQVRRLYRRDATDSTLLLRMATEYGRSALGLDHAPQRAAAAAFDPDDSTPAWTQVLRGTGPLRPVGAV